MTLELPTLPAKRINHHLLKGFVVIVEVVEDILLEEVFRLLKAFVVQDPAYTRTEKNECSEARQRQLLQEKFPN